MKKIIFLSLIFSIFFVTYAQVPGSIGFRKASTSYKGYGIKGGLNLSNIHGEEAKHNSSRTGFIAGFFYEKKISEAISIQPEIFYSLKGWNVEDIIDSVFTLKFRSKLQYLEIPIIFKYKLHNTFDFIPIFYFGPCFGLNIGSKYYSKLTTTYWGEYYSDNCRLKKMNIFEFSIVPGLSIEFNNFIFDCRYSISLTDTGGEYNIYYDYKEKLKNVKNSVFSLMLGYKL